MQDSQDIIYGVTGQSLYYDCPEGRPSSVVSSVVYDDMNGDTSTAEFTPTGTVDTNPNTTIDAASGFSESDPTKLNVTATTGFARRRRFIVNSAVHGGTEWFECDRIVSADYVTARSPFLNDYASNDTVQTTRISAPVDATWVATESKLSDPGRTTPRYRWRLVYVVGGVTYAASNFLDLVRYEWRHTVTAVDVERYSNGWMSRLSTDDRRSQGYFVIDEAARQVKEDMRARGLADYSQRNSEFINGLVVRKAVYVGLHHAFMHGAVNPDFMQQANADYFAFLDKSIRETVTQATTDGAATQTIVHELFER